MTFPLPDDIALFLDFDGTLVSFAETPDGVVVPSGLVPLLIDLEVKLDGALAFVTGRSVDNLDALLGTNRFKTVGVHGAEWRIEDEGVEHVNGEPFTEQRDAIAAFCASHRGLVLQEKSVGFTLHYRQALHMKDEAERELRKTFRNRSDFEIMGGEKMWEARRVGVDKGRGIERLMKARPFAGRIPAFIGDDVTDEDGHRAVNAMDGHSIKVGGGDSAARHRLPDIPSVYQFLKELNGKEGAR